MTTDHKAQVEAAREECVWLGDAYSASCSACLTPLWHKARSDFHAAIDRLAALASAPPAPASEKIAPVQGWPAGIPWSLHLEAYAVYCKRWSPQPALIDLEGRNCRGGFTVGELDEFIPGWRGRVSEARDVLVRDIKAAIAELAQGKKFPDLIDAIDRLADRAAIKGEQHDR